MGNLSQDTKVFIFLIFVSVLHMAYYYPQMPESLASHFDIAGKAENWTGKDVFFLTYAGVVALMALLFLGSRFIMEKLPEALINLPNKTYWLAPERKAETYSYLSTQLTWFGCASVLFIIGCMHLAIRSNLTGENTIAPGIWLLTTAYLIFTLFWIVRFVRRFMKKEPERM
ncbi:MAG: DUF1648 domain-containing protein [Deltaproteobacteria bacterium]|nr:DUF1648 domain-containing protein [Deltaproteobacteria bacterium]